MNRNPLVALAGLGLTAALFAACASEATGDQAIGVVVPVESGGSYLDILSGELNDMLSAKDFVLVNVHVPNEGEIPGTDLHLPFDSIGLRAAELPAFRDAKLVLYCRSGSMSAIAARELVGLGYSQIYNLDGGFRAWIQAGYPFDG